MNDVNIGEAIEKRLKELHLSKTEFGRLMGMPQQNVNRILRNKHINTEKLVTICDLLSYNFFRLYCEEQSPINAVATGNSSIAAVNSEVLTTDSERVRFLERLLAEKERLIQFLMRESEQKTVG
jgi:transcriptional regulator with XRE-family HTH domain